MKNPVDSFSAALRAARAKRHLTQRALADNLHMSVRTIIEIELGRSNHYESSVFFVIGTGNKGNELIAVLGSHPCIVQTFSL